MLKLIENVASGQACSQFLLDPSYSKIRLSFLLVVSSVSGELSGYVWLLTTSPCQTCLPIPSLNGSTINKRLGSIYLPWQLRFMHPSFSFDGCVASGDPPPASCVLWPDVRGWADLTQKARFFGIFSMVSYALKIHDSLII